MNKLQNIQEPFVPYLHAEVKACNLVFTQRTNFIIIVVISVAVMQKMKRVAIL